jgi:hypothetical protein
LTRGASIDNIIRCPQNEWNCAIDMHACMHEYMYVRTYVFKKSICIYRYSLSLSLSPLPPSLSHVSSDYAPRCNAWNTYNCVCMYTCARIPTHVSWPACRLCEGSVTAGTLGIRVIVHSYTHANMHMHTHIQTYAPELACVPALQGLRRRWNAWNRRLCPLQHVCQREYAHLSVYIPSTFAWRTHRNACKKSMFMLRRTDIAFIYTYICTHIHVRRLLTRRRRRRGLIGPRDQITQRAHISVDHNSVFLVACVTFVFSSFQRVFFFLQGKRRSVPMRAYCDLRRPFLCRLV